MWGRAVLDKKGADVAKEVDKAFSSKPCLRDIWSQQTYKRSARPFVSSMCLKWTQERYGSLTPALCKACKKLSPEIKAEESLDHNVEAEPKAETGFDSNCQGEIDMEHYMEGYFAEDQGEYDVKEEDVLKVSSNEPPDEDLEKKQSVRYICKICDKVYKSWRSLLFHRDTYHREKTCLECEEKFASANLLKAHCESSNHGLRYKCDFCDDGFNNKVDRLKHAKKDHKAQDDATILDHLRDKTTRYVCKICNKVYRGMQCFLEHGKRKHNEKTCLECKKIFSSPSLLKAHCASVNHDLHHKCNFCDEEFNDKKYRIRHVRKDHKVKDDASILEVETVQYNCPLCPESFGSDKYRFWGHLRSIHRDESLDCEVESCRYACVGKQLLEAHCASMIHALLYKCDFCEEEFNNKMDRSQHVETDHKVQDDATSLKVQGVQAVLYNCPLCPESFGSDKYRFWGHLRSIHRDESVDCEVESCRYACVGKPLMFLHTSAKHKKQGNGLQMTHTCDICGRQIHRAQMLFHYKKEHNISLDDGCRYVCQYCGEALKTRKVKMDHINRAHLKVSFGCEKCGKSFKQSSKLRQHLQKVHMKESQKKQCHICQEWLRDAEDLATHVRRRHTGEKPFPCIFCQESFFSSQHAVSHRRSQHPDSYNADQKRKAWLQENPTKDPLEYKMMCHLCSEVISTIDDLRHHWDEVHPGVTDIPVKWNMKNIICELCGDELQTNTRLKIHTFEHHEPEATKCPVCMKEFPSRDGTIAHIKEDHGKPPSLQKNATCEHCGYTNTPGSVKKHMRIHDKSFSRPTTCTYCGKEFLTYHKMSAHRRGAHREQWVLDKDRLLAEEGSEYQGKHKDYFMKFYKKATCAVCGVTLCSRTQLNLHMKAKHGAGLPDYGLHRGRRPNPENAVVSVVNV